jgi:hexosaminidase
MKINYAKSLFDIHSALSSDENGVYVTLTTAKKGAKIFYTRYSFFDPKAAIQYTAPIRITDDISISALAYFDSVPICHQFYLSLSVNKATGKPILLRKPPSPEYNDGSPGKLNDGQVGRMPWVGSDWLGWSGDTMDAMIDLQQVTSINEISISTLFDPGSWIYTPGNFLFQVSDDGKTFTNLKQLLESDEGDSRWHIFKPQGMSGRYIRIVVSGMKKIPSGSPGEGNPPWLFVDEIQVK